MAGHDHSHVVGDARKRLEQAEADRERIAFDVRPECHSCGSRKPHLHSNGKHSIHMADYTSSDPT